MSSSRLAPPWWVLGDALYADILAHPTARAAAIASLRAPMHPRPSARLPVPQREDPHSIAALRRQGISLCSRTRSEQEIAARLESEAVIARALAQEAEEAVVETQRQIDEGLILPDGTPAPPKRKRASRGPTFREPSSGGLLPDGTPAPPRVPRPPRPSEMLAAERREKEKAAKLAAKEKAAAEKEQRKAAEAEAAAAAAAAAKKAKKKKLSNQAPAFVPEQEVEVALRLGESFANWYRARILSPEVKGRWKLRLMHVNDKGVDEDTVLEGRGETESGTITTLRPPPQAELYAGWKPSPGDPCELYFQNGWWKVRVTEAAGAGEWTVFYAPASAAHTVPAKLLRPISTYDPITRVYSVHKPGRR